MDVIIYHNPECGTSRNALGLIRNAGDAQLLDAMLKNPILINRPIVVTPLGVKLCRPSESVLDTLLVPQKGEFRTEDGELVVTADGRRAANA